MKKFLTLLSVFIFTAISFAQTTEPTPPIEEDDEIITVESRLIIVPVSVTDGQGNPVKGLGVENFRVKEENRNQKISPCRKWIQ